MSIILQFKDFLNSTRKQAVQLQKAEVEENTPCFDHFFGVDMEWRPFYSDRRHIRRELLFDGYKFACELEWHDRGPWRLDIETDYWLWTDLPEKVVKQLIKQLPERLREALSPMEEFYPGDTDVRWNVYGKGDHALEAAAALWKRWHPIYRPDDKNNEKNKA